jgi:hypothetical protein
MAFSTGVSRAAQRLREGEDTAPPPPARQRRGRRKKRQNTEAPTAKKRAS